MSDLKQILRENILRLLNAERRLKRAETGISRLVAKGIGQGTAQRILGGKTSVGLEVLEQLADALGVSPWRLIQPQSPDETSGDFSRAGRAGQPSAAGREVALLFDSLLAVERNAVKTILKKMGSAVPAEESTVETDPCRRGDT